MIKILHKMKILCKSMFVILIFIFTASNSFSQNKGIKWITFEELPKKIKETPKKVLIDVYTEWCGPCKMMSKNTFHNNDVAAYINENYYAIKFNAESGKAINFKGKVYKNPNYRPLNYGRNATHEFTFQIAAVNGRVAYPTVVYFDENLNKITSVQGYFDVKDIEPILKFIATSSYKSQKYQDFMANFKNEFK